jgi:hypothetical protein
MSDADGYYLSQYDNNPKAYLGFAVTRSVDDAVTRTSSDCSEESLTFPDPTYRVGPLKGCPPATNLEATPVTTPNGQRTLDFACSSDTTTSGVRSQVQVSGTLVRNP